MKYAIFALSFLVIIAASAKPSDSLVLSGTVPEKIDYQVRYDRGNNQWRLVQTTNGQLRASLVKNKNTPYVVSVRAP